MTFRVTHATDTLALARAEIERYQLPIESEINPDLLSPWVIRGMYDGRAQVVATTPLNLLYAVYFYAENFGGWCFFEPGSDRFSPNLISELDIGAEVVAPTPRLPRRGFIQEFPFDADTPMLFDWMAKNSLNYLLVWMKYYDALAPELKEMARIRGIEIESGHHNFNYWIPPEKYGESHPEFFALKNGKRLTDGAKQSDLFLSKQLCTTNSELRDEICRNMLDYADKNPELRCVSLIPNDGFGWCECPKCSAFYDTSHHGDLYSVSAHVYKADRIYHDMVRYVGRELRRHRPDLNLSFIAYVNYCAPSKNFTLERGMQVHFAPYWRCVNHRIDDASCSINRRYFADIQSWLRARDGGKFFIYEYYMGVNFYLSLPLLFIDKLESELNLYQKLGVDGLLTQFHLSHWSVYGVNYYLFARLSAGEGTEQVMLRFYRSVFGMAAAAEACRLYQAISEFVTKLGACHIPYPDALLRRCELADCQTLLTLARELAEKCPGNDFATALTIWLNYVVEFKKLYDLVQDGVATVDDVDKLERWIASHATERVFVVFKFFRYFAAWKDALRAGKKPLHFNIDWEDEYIRQHRETILK